jgi:hypothetical protein
LIFSAKNHPKFSLPSTNFLTRASPTWYNSINAKVRRYFWHNAKKKTVVAATVFFCFQRKLRLMLVAFVLNVLN